MAKPKQLEHANDFDDIEKEVEDHTWASLKVESCYGGGWTWRLSVGLRGTHIRVKAAGSERTRVAAMQMMLALHATLARALAKGPHLTPPSATMTLTHAGNGANAPADVEGRQ